MSAVRILGSREGRGGVPLGDWAVWWTLLAIADVLFYLVLTPVWLGIRGAAWIAEARARRRAA